MLRCASATDMRYRSFNVHCLSHTRRPPWAAIGHRWRTVARWTAIRCWTQHISLRTQRRLRTRWKVERAWLRVWRHGNAIGRAYDTWWRSVRWRMNYVCGRISRAPVKTWWREIGRCHVQSALRRSGNWRPELWVFPFSPSWIVVGITWPFNRQSYTSIRRRIARNGLVRIVCLHWFSVRYVDRSFSVMIDFEMLERIV